MNIKNKIVLCPLKLFVESGCKFNFGFTAKINALYYTFLNDL